jgi:hypothetical protein
MKGNIFELGLNRDSREPYRLWIITFFQSIDGDRLFFKSPWTTFGDMVEVALFGDF